MEKLLEESWMNNAKDFLKIQELEQQNKEMIRLQKQKWVIKMLLALGLD